MQNALLNHRVALQYQYIFIRLINLRIIDNLGFKIFIFSNVVLNHQGALPTIYINY